MGLKVLRALLARVDAIGVLIGVVLILWAVASLFTIEAAGAILGALLVIGGLMPDRKKARGG